MTKLRSIRSSALGSSHNVKSIPPSERPSRAVPRQAVRLRDCAAFMGEFILLLFTGFAVAGQPAPRLSAISPEWIQRGTTITVTLTGENLGDVTRILFNGDGGLSASNVLPALPPVQSNIAVESTAGGITRAEAARPKRDEKKLVLKATAPAD